MMFTIQEAQLCVCLISASQFMRLLEPWKLSPLPPEAERLRHCSGPHCRNDSAQTGPAPSSSSPSAFPAAFYWSWIIFGHPIPKAACRYPQHSAQPLPGGKGFLFSASLDRVSSHGEDTTGIPVVKMTALGLKWMHGWRPFLYSRGTYFVSTGSPASFLSNRYDHSVAFQEMLVTFQRKAKARLWWLLVTEKIQGEALL